MVSYNTQVRRATWTCVVLWMRVRAVIMSIVENKLLARTVSSNEDFLLGQEQVIFYFCVIPAY